MINNEQDRSTRQVRNRTSSDGAVLFYRLTFRTEQGIVPTLSKLGLSPDQLLLDLNTFGFLFETLCIRDLKVYSSSQGGTVSYYHDRLGLEADCVLHLADGRYALIEFKLGSREIAEGANHLLDLQELIRAYNQRGEGFLAEPQLLMVITGGELAYRRPDGVYIIPIGCLKD